MNEERMNSADLSRRPKRASKEAKKTLAWRNTNVKRSDEIPKDNLSKAPVLEVMVVGKENEQKGTVVRNPAVAAVACSITVLSCTDDAFGVQRAT
jgi:hypothetical protein